MKRLPTLPALVSVTLLLAACGQSEPVTPGAALPETTLATAPDHAAPAAP